MSNFVDPPDDYGPVIDYEDLFWDLSSESIVLGPKLGEGSFGTESDKYKILSSKYKHDLVQNLDSKWSDLHGNNKLFERNFDTFKGL